MVRNAQCVVRRAAVMPEQSSFHCRDELKPAKKAGEAHAKPANVPQGTNLPIGISLHRVEEIPYSSPA